MKFEKDVFISYAHYENEILSDGLKGWITEFHQSLEVTKKMSGQSLVICRDLKLRGNDDFSPEMQEQFSQFKIMVCIITPGYLNSAWCLREVDLFYKAAELTGGIAVENKAPIFNVIKSREKLEDHLKKFDRF